MARGSSRGRLLGVLGASAALLVVALGAGLSLGVEAVHPLVALRDPGSADARILFVTRVPRVLLAVLIGAALAPAGVAFQALLRNPLAEPYVLGVAGGAAAVGTAAVVLFAHAGAGVVAALGEWTLPVWSFFGALASIAVVFAFGRVRGRLVPNVALLAGVVLNGLAGALILVIRLFATPASAHQALYWLSGSLNSPSATRLLVLAVYVPAGVLALVLLAVPMNALALGEEAAHVVGVDTERARRLIFVAASLLTGAAVAFAGPVGFVGILVPHAVRALVGPDHRVLVPASALVGAAFLVVADTCARLSFLALETEVPVGVLTALAGAPFFLVVLRRRGGERVL